MNTINKSYKETSMKKLFISSIVMASSLFTVAACAQTGAMNTMPQSDMQQGQMQQNMMSNMASALNLTAEQQAQMQAIRQNNRGNHMQNHNAMMQVLTPKQRQKMAEIRSQYMNQGGQMMNKGRHMMNQGSMTRDGRMMNQGQNLPNQN